MSRLACEHAERVLAQARPAREWLEARRRGEGDPGKWMGHSIKVQGLHAELVHLVDELDEWGYGEIEGRRRLAEARDELRKLSEEIVKQSIDDENRAKSS